MAIFTFMQSYYDPPFHECHLRQSASCWYGYSSGRHQMRLCPIEKNQSFEVSNIRFHTDWQTPSHMSPLEVGSTGWGKILLSSYYVVASGMFSTRLAETFRRTQKDTKIRSWHFWSVETYQTHLTGLGTTLKFQKCSNPAMLRRILVKNHIKIEYKRENRLLECSPKLNHYYHYHERKSNR